MNNKAKFLQRNVPCYLYKEDLIKEHCHDLLNTMPGVDFLYSIKTNPFMPVLKTVATQSFGADAASANEMLMAHEAGIPCDKIYYSAPGKTLQDLEKVWRKCTIIADSLSELARLEQCAEVKNECISIGVRVNPNFSMNGESVVSSKFGIDENQLKTADLCFPHLKIIGIHVHLRSQSEFCIVGRNENCETVDIVGNLCTALDVMAKNITLPHAEIGDILAVSNAGSYGCTLTPLLFSNQETPKEFLWTKENE